MLCINDLNPVWALFCSLRRIIFYFLRSRAFCCAPPTYSSESGREQQQRRRRQWCGQAKQAAGVGDDQPATTTQVCDSCGRLGGAQLVGEAVGGGQGHVEEVFVLVLGDERRRRDLDPGQLCRRSDRHAHEHVSGQEKVHQSD